MYCYPLIFFFILSQSIWLVDRVMVQNHLQKWPQLRNKQPSIGYGYMFVDIIFSISTWMVFLNYFAFNYLFFSINFVGSHTE